METSALNTHEEKTVETWLRNQPVDTLADDGFTQRVMAALPAPRAQGWPENRGRLALITIGTLLGYWIATHGSGSDPKYDESLIAAVSVWSSFTQSLADPAVLLIFVLAVGSLLLTSSAKLSGIDPEQE